MSGPFDQAFRGELLRVARRDERRRRYTVRGAIVAAVAAVAGVLAITLPGNPAAADVRVTVENDQLEVRLTDSTSTPREVLEALHDHGITATTVGSVPTGPSSVGRIVRVVFEEAAGSPAHVTYLAPSGSAYLGFRVPADWPGEMTISLGRPARPGEAYDGPTDAFLPGEALHCAGLRGRTLAEAADAVGDLTVRVAIHAGPDLGRQLTLSEALAADYGGWHVNRAFAVSATAVVLEVDRTAADLPDGDDCS